MLIRICIFKKGPDDDLKRVETCGPTEYNNINKERVCLTDVILIFMYL